MTRRHFPDNEIWANNPAEIDSPDPALYQTAYESGEGKTPPRAGVHNYLLNRSDEQHQHIEQNGIPRWLTDTIYPDGGLCLGADDVIYQSQGDANQGNNPTADDGTNWQPLPSVNIYYDNTGSTLSAENVKAAIDEVDGKVESLTASGSVLDTQTFTASGTWTKPASAAADDTVIARMWGGGGSGGAITAANSSCSGGNGGAFLELSFRASALSASESVTVGAGGASAGSSSGGTSGNNGGDTQFAGFTASGGTGGTTSTTTTVNPPAADGYLVPTVTTEFSHGIYVGAQGGGVQSGTREDGGDAVFGGAGGAGAGGSAGADPVGGVSWKGGDGGTAISAASVAGTTAESGDAPGGGGGAAQAASVGVFSGAGGDGRVEIYVIKGWSPQGIIGSH